MGWAYNVVDPAAPSNFSSVIGVGIFFTILSLTVVGIRVYVRGWVVKRVRIDDWIIVLAWFMSFTFHAIALSQTKWGLGLQNESDMPPENVLEFNMLQYAGAPFYILSILGFKLSALFAFLRLAVNRVHRFGIISLIILTSLIYTSCFIAQLMICKPTPDSAIPSQCPSQIPFNLVLSALTLLLDFLVLLTPIPILLHSCYSLRKNLIISLIYAFSIFITLLQIARINALKSSSFGAIGTLHTWSIIETNLGIVLVSLLGLEITVQNWLEGTPQSIAQSLASFDTRRSYVKMKDYVRGKFGREGHVRRKVVLFLGYGDMKTDEERGASRMGMGSRLGSRLGTREGRSTEELGQGFPMGILKTTEVIITREGDEEWDRKE